MPKRSYPRRFRTTNGRPCYLVIDHRRESDMKGFTDIGKFKSKRIAQAIAELLNAAVAIDRREAGRS